ncbi:MAG: hypothetical protein AAFY56_03045, partial [Pseudomonadota bacterium]
SLGFRPDEVKSVRYDRRITDSQVFGGTRLQGFNAWVNFDDRSGYLVISYNTSCFYNTHYTRAGLELPTPT